MTRQLKRHFLLLAAVACVLVSASCRAFAASLAAHEKNPDVITLQVSVVLDAPVTTLAFTLTNRQKHQLLTTPITTEGNRIVVTGPDGHESDIDDWWSLREGETVEPGQSKTWFVQIAAMKVLDEEKSGVTSRPPKLSIFSKPGTYRLSWKLMRAEPGRVFLSNEIYITPLASITPPQSSKPATQLGDSLSRRHL